VRALDVALPGERIYTVAVRGQTATELAAALDKILQATHRAATGGEGEAEALVSPGSVRRLRCPPPSLPSRRPTSW